MTAFPYIWQLLNRQNPYQVGSQRELTGSLTVTAYSKRNQYLSKYNIKLTHFITYSLYQLVSGIISSVVLAYLVWIQFALTDWGLQIIGCTMRKCNYWGTKGNLGNLKISREWATHRYDGRVHLTVMVTLKNMDIIWHTYCLNLS